MKRLRPRCFKEVLGKESAIAWENGVDYIRVERLRRLIWCYNKYHYLDYFTPYLLFLLSAYRGKIRHDAPNVWIPEIRTE